LPLYQVIPAARAEELTAANGWSYREDASGGQSSDADWGRSHGNEGCTRYSPLAQIDRGNVGRLRVAWTYRTGDTTGTASRHVAFEATPIVVDGTLYLSTA